MTRLILHLPGWTTLDGPSVLDAPGDAWRKLFERGTVRRLRSITEIGAREADWLGLKREEVQLSEGALIVAAVGANPPPGSVHFAVAPLVLEGAGLRRPETRLTEVERKEIIQCAERLNTRQLTFVWSANPWGLVWEEGSLDLATMPPAEVGGYRASLPQGDGEPLLRRWIDDSVNLLGECKFNRRREDEGIEPINVLWPWGHGMRSPMPNLALRYGVPIRVVSASWRLKGLSRLCGISHGFPGAFGQGTNTRLEMLIPDFLGVTIGVLDVFERFHPVEHESERRWLTQEMETRLWRPLLEVEDLVLTVASHDLVLDYDARMPMENSVPFDERVLDDRSVGMLDRVEISGTPPLPE